MSDVLFTYKETNKLDKYFTMVSSEQAKINDVVSMFMKELTTVRGSNMFNKMYGTSFMDDISEQVNIYKIQYFFDKRYEDTFLKYGIVRVEATDVKMNSSSGFMDIKMKIFFKDLALEHYTSFLYNGIYTENTIVEMD